MVHMSFTIRCNECGLTVDITKDNVEYFVNEYAWNRDNFKITDDSPIGAFITYDTPNATVICKCGHRVSE